MINPLPNNNPTMPASNGTPPPASPPFQEPPAGPGERRVAPIWMAPEDFTRTQNELRTLREYKAEQEKLAELAEADRVKLLTDKGQIEEAYNMQKLRYEQKLTEASTRAQTIEKQWLEEKRVAAINEALEGRQFAGVDPKATAKLVRTLLESEIEAVMGEGASPVIRDRKTLRPAVDYLPERLNSPDLALFFKAETRGGAGTDGTRTPANQPKPAEGSYEAWAADYRKRREDFLKGRIPGVVA